MTRQTSIAAYRSIKENGLLSKRRWEVYDYLFVNGPCTALRVWREVAPKSANGGITTRFSELKRMGVVQEVGETKDATGMRAILWDVTARLPIPLQKKAARSRKQLLKEMVLYLDSKEDLPEQWRKWSAEAKRFL